MRVKRASAILAVGWLLVVSCEGCGEDDLSEGAVLDIGAGDAVGESTLELDVEIVATSCEGACGLVTLSDDRVISTCDIGLRERVVFLLRATDGALRVDVRGSDRMSQLAGGLDADGTFEAGGVYTYGGGVSPNQRMRSRISGELEAWTSWRIQTAIELYASGPTCSGEYEVVDL